MFVGTGSDVGKSWIVAGVCRWMKQNGYNPAPFKAQNMSLNSFATPNGLEIGRAQAVQAEACSIACSTDMNPILLKPSSQNRSQIVLNGKPVGNQSAKEYFLGNNKQNLFEEAKQAFFRLSEQYSPVIMEGAGSISELNLKHRDIVNMRMAKAANACVYLVADIDRGGVFGSVYGTIALLEDWERELVKGVVINKFRGDVSLFEDGKKMLEKLTGIPILGVLPYAKNIVIEEEDSVALKKRKTTAEKNKLNIAVVQLNYMSNYTDFQSLEQEDGVCLYYTQNIKELSKADIIILPGSKNTIEDLIDLQSKGITKYIKSQYNKKPIIGICGGYQMLGKSINDPDGVESSHKKIEGIGIFDIETTLTKTKDTFQREFYFKNNPRQCIGYEIHMGKTEVNENFALNNVDGLKEGYYDGNMSWGTYMHGIFDNSAVVDELLQIKYPNRKAKDYKGFKSKQYDLLAKLVDENLNMKQVLKDISEL